MSGIARGLWRAPWWIWVVAWIALAAFRVITKVRGPLDDITWVLFVGATAVVLLVLVRGLVRSLQAKRWGRAAVALLALLLLSVPVRHVLFPSDSYLIENAVDAAFTSDDPEYCTDDVTETFMEQHYKVTSPYADDFCEEYSDHNRADSVDIRDIEVDGDRATAAVEVDGGSLDGQRVEVALVKDEGDWRVDRVIRYLALDRGAAERAYAAEYARLGAPASAQACVVAATRGYSDSEFERIGLSASPQTSTEVAVQCDRSGVERRLADRFRDARYGPLPPAAINCVVDRVRKLSDRELGRLIRDPASYGALGLQCDREDSLRGLQRQLEPYEDLGASGARCVVDQLRGLPAREIVRLTYDDSAYERVIDHCKS